MKKFLSLLMAGAFCWFAYAPSLQAQSTKAPAPPPPEVWGPHLPGTDPQETSACVKKCNTEFEKELKRCLALEGSARADCEQPVREQHRTCFTACPR